METSPLHQGLYNPLVVNSATVVFPLLISSYLSYCYEWLTEVHFHLLLWCDSFTRVLLSALGHLWAMYSQCDGAGYRIHRALIVLQKHRAHQTPFILSRLTGKYVNVHAVRSQTYRGKTAEKKPQTHDCSLGRETDLAFCRGSIHSNQTMQLFLLQF